MALVSTNEFKAGLKVLLESQPCSIIENEFVKPGKGQAFNRVKMRNLLNGRVIEKTFKSGDTLEAADVNDIEANYLYNDGQFWFFMQPESFEQYQATKEVLGETIFWLKEADPNAKENDKEQDIYMITLWNGQPLAIEPPNVVHLRVTETDPGLKGDTAGSGGKPATLETGAVVRVPLFVNIGDVLKVNTKTKEYLSRVKE